MKKSPDLPRPEWFAGRLRELREAVGLTQKQLAEQIGGSGRTITYLEAGDRKPSWETVISLANALGVSVAEFAERPADEAERQRGRPKKKKPT